MRATKRMLRARARAPKVRRYRSYLRAHPAATFTPSGMLYDLVDTDIRAAFTRVTPELSWFRRVAG